MSQRQDRRKIAYVVSRFPHLPETFILREMIELERLGWDIALYPLIFQKQAVVHAEAQAWMPRAQKIPFLSLTIVAENARMAVRRPARYGSLLGRILLENRTDVKFLLRAVTLFPKAVYAARRMQKEGIEHIHAHYATHPALFAWLIHQMTGISFSVTAHAHDIFVSRSMLAAKLRDAVFIVTISDFNCRYLAEHVGPWTGDKTHIIHCGIDPDNYPLRAASPAGEQRQRFEILSIGSLQPYKGQSFLIQACAMLKKRGIPFRCRIIGGGEEASRLQQMIAENELLNDEMAVVDLMGPQTQTAVAEILPQADCYIQPSIITSSGKMEGIPVALMEALVCQVPSIATNISGIPELVQPGKTGYLVPPADATALADALETVYKNPVEAGKRARAGRELVIRSFNLHTNVAQLSSLFAAIHEPIRPTQPAGSHG